MFIASVLGGFIGILFRIPFRKYFVKDMHGKLPFPEGTATTEILVTGERGGNEALVLVLSGLIVGAFDFTFSALGLWSEVVTSRMFAWGEAPSDKFKMVLKLDVSAVILGLGYIIGLRYSAIIVAGGFKLAFNEITHRKSGEAGDEVRTKREIGMLWIVMLILLTSLAVFAFFAVGVVALLLVVLKVPPLAFALGMYIPQELNTPLLVGGAIAWLVSTRSKNEKLNIARLHRGTLIVSGFIAGGALLGVLNAFLKFIDMQWPFGYAGWFNVGWAESHGGEIAGLVMFILLCCYALWDSMRAKE